MVCINCWKIKEVQQRQYEPRSRSPPDHRTSFRNHCWFDDWRVCKLTRLFTASCWYSIHWFLESSLSGETTPLIEGFTVGAMCKVKISFYELVTATICKKEMTENIRWIIFQVISVLKLELLHILVSGQMVRSSVHVITDSLLAHIKLGEEQRLAKNPAMLLPLEPKTTKLIERPSLQSRVKISQNSISGLRGFGGWSMGNDRRSQAFKTVQEQIMNGTTPEAVFVILGINDIRTVDRKDKDKPGVMVERILEFFWELRQLLPNSRVVWCSIGNLWRDHKAFDFHKQCQVFLESTNGLFPEWLQFLQLSGDATDTDIKDRHGHWTDQYAERIGNRILDLIESFIAETDNTPREDGITG